MFSITGLICSIVNVLHLARLTLTALLSFTTTTNVRKPILHASCYPVSVVRGHPYTTSSNFWPLLTLPLVIPGGRVKPIKATNKTLSLLFYRWTDTWNSLPVSLRLSASLPAFKRGLKNIDLSSFLKGSV
jgi:hypothetical protein